MLTLIPNDEKTSLQFIFEDFFTKEKQFVTAFDISESKKIAEGILEFVKEMEK